MDTSDNTIGVLNEVKLKKILSNLEQRHAENQKLRIKYSDDPAKFATSETEVYATLDELQSISTQPELYHVLISKKAVPILISLLAHENTDISAKVIHILQEMVDLDEVEGQEATERLIEELNKENIVALLVSNLSRLKESVKEEANAINNSLAIIESLIDYDSQIATVSPKPLIQWMLKRLKANSEFNSVKLSISELLSVLLMNAHENRLLLGELNGLEVLLKQLAYYRRIAPVTGDEHEFLEQIVNCLCTCIQDCDQNRELFFEEEGVHLIELILREKKEAAKKSNIKLSSLKLFNHVLATDKNNDPIVAKCCSKFVEIFGLRVLFPIFNNPKLALSEKVKKREYHQILNEIEEHTAAIMLALLKYCQNNEYIQRILVKFAESNFEKLNRLIKLHEKYFRIVSNEDDDIEQGEYNVSAGEAYKSSHRFTLRTTDYIILLICYLSDHFETYDPKSGETFKNYLGNLLKCRPQLRHQIMMEVGKHIEEVQGESLEEHNSLKLLLEHFEQTAIAKKST